MGGMFNINSGFFNIMSKIFDIMMVSLIWSFLCVPIVTAGPATVALYYSVVKSVRKDRGYVTKEFFKAFKLNLKQGMIAGVLVIFMLFLLTLNISYVKMMANQFGLFLHYFYLALMVVVLCMAVYIFPVISRFTVTFRNLIKLTFFFSIRHFLTTVVSLVIVAAGVVIVFFSYFFGLVFVPGVCTFLISFLMEKVLKRYTPEEEGETAVDAWYLE